MKHSSSAANFSFKEILSVALIGIVGAIIWGQHIGQDLNPDLVNYHFYNAYLVFHKDRLVTDIFPAGIQGYLNPYLYAIFYSLYSVLPPKGVGMVIGTLHGLCFISVYVVSRILLANWSIVAGRWMAFACAVFGTINPFFLAMVGSSFSDNMTPPLILIPLALILLVRFPGTSKLALTVRQFYLALIAAGLMLGLAVGFKLTNCAYVLGLVAAWFFRFRFSRQDILGAFALFGAVVAGFLFVSAEWMWRLYAEFQNPTFPFYNQIFKSPMIGDIHTNVPAIAAAHSFYDLLAYPYRWMVGIPPETEWNFRDARFAILYTLLAALFLLRFVPALMRKAGMIRSFNTSASATGNKTPAYIFNRYGFIAIWALISYLFWIDQFGALRYLMPVTLLTGTLMLICLVNLIPSRKIAVYLWVILAVISLITINLPPYGRVKWKYSWYPVQIPEQLMESRNTLYLKDSLSFVIPFFPEDAHFISPGYLTSDQDGMTQRARKMIADHQGPMRSLLLLPRQNVSFVERLKQLGLRMNLYDCVNFKGGVYLFQSCRIERLSRNQKPFILPFRTELRFDEWQSSPWILSTKGFSSQEPQGIWTQGNTAEIKLLGFLPKKFKLHINAVYIFGKNDELPFQVIIGKQKKQFTFGKNAKSATVAFNLNTAREDKIIIKIPKPASPHSLEPNSADTRELGMMLQSIVFEK